MPWAFADLLLWVPAGLLATWVRLDFTVLVISGLTSWVISTFLIMAVLHLLMGSLLGAYPPKTRFDPLGRQSLGVIALSATVAGIVGVVILSAAPVVELPRSVPLISALLVILGAFLLRTALLAWNTYQLHSREPVIVIGAGLLGRHIIAELGDPQLGNDMAIKAVLDDNPRMHGARLHGVKVRGGLDQISEVAAQTGATTLIVAINGLGPTVKSKITAVAAELGLKVLVVPTMEEINRIGSLELQELDLTSLMGRDQIVLDEDSISGLIRGRRVLVTGAGGSIGSELARQIHKYGPSELIMLDRDEGGLHHTQLSIYGHAMLDSKNIVLADIRDAARLKEIFLECRPEVVLHAAALKHQPLLEMYPQEAWLTNVEGTRNVLDASVACRTEVVVNVSTDKAANPVCALGDSKRIAERITAAYGAEYPGTWVSVRFGNVLGSRGSVIETFRRQIETGGPVTVTHPEVRRYFMTIPEAAQLVLQAAVVGESGETLVLDMGSPMPIVELAQGLMKIAGRDDLEIVYTGLRPGEKMSEELLDDREDPIRADRHPMISEVRVEPLTQLPDCAPDANNTLRALARTAHSEEPSLL
ncbi:nucleoside-diphosphate sugar epimerase/dehydratase [Corynebacterium maris]|uniref:nucleoside-diphosphate sugar epimerase/dehydratase n=1 Tax=Corynebacterium maris TaxID=575200 RepID=UPI00146DC152|nr:nucleoside-diphosphate sugar epimerase/dehydratase [Corynebacterium maris]